MPRLVAGLEYKGSGFAGWQKQPGQITIAEQVELALSEVANHQIDLVVAGRTDKGVHACQQVVHFDSNSDRSIKNWILGANQKLPSAIKLQWLQTVNDNFHARFSARSRRYCYLIYNSAFKPALLNEYCDWQYVSLDDQTMNRAAQRLVGYHDFSNFRSSDCQAKTSFRQVHFANIIRSGNWLRFDIQANAFLHKMVRMIIAELIAIGKGKHATDRIAQLIDKSDRQNKPVANARGLFLTHIGYDNHWQLPITAAEKLFLYKL